MNSNPEKVPNTVEASEYQKQQETAI